MGEQKGAAGEKGDAIGPQGLGHIAGEDPVNPAVRLDDADAAVARPIGGEQPSGNMAEDAFRTVQAAPDKAYIGKIDHGSLSAAAVIDGSEICLIIGYASGRFYRKQAMLTAHALTYTLTQS
jgi:hypothetical protein